MAKDMLARQLIKQMPGVHVTNIDFAGQTSTIALGEGWEIIGAGTLQCWVWRGYIDLAGYTQDDLTFFSQAIDIQNSLSSSGSTGFELCDDRTLVTTRRISDGELSANSSGLLSTMNGFISSFPAPKLDLQEIIYGEWKQFVPYSATNGSFRVIAGDSFGTGNPTASERIHITRMITFQAAGSDDVLVIQPQNIIIGGVTAHEKDLVYIERLRRAYTQQRSEV
jgi:hypothetical protein